jgi:hypothetical protein
MVSWLLGRDCQLTVGHRHLSVQPSSQFTPSVKDGIPYLAPEIALLYKSRNRREADEADFRAAQRTLDAEQREWLRSALGKTSPGHAWLAKL